MANADRIEERDFLVSAPIEDLLAPISPSEVAIVVKSLKPSANGADRVSLQSVQKLSADVLSAHFNLWLLAERLQNSLNVSRTIFIPKVSRPRPLEHRPISLCSHVTRLFHQILASRFEKLVPLSEKQKSFRKLDGVGANLTLARSLKDYAKQARRSISLFFVDVKKAFDSVLHGSMLAALKLNGVPRRLREYIGNIHSRATTVFEYGGRVSGLVSSSRGVRQGDPLSSFLFNLTLDLTLRSLPEELGFSLNGVKLNHLAYADDTVLVTETSEGMKLLLQSFAELAGKTGLELKFTSGKCASLSMRVSKKDRNIHFSAKPITIDGNEIPIVDLEKRYKYLSIFVSALEKFTKAQEKLMKGMTNLSSAPLKPQQSFFILRDFLIPKIMHDLVFTNHLGKSLRASDRAIRASVRQWMKWPKDAPLGLFHCTVSDGGLGIPSLRHEVPILVSDRMVNLFMNNNDPALTELCQLEPLKSRLSKVTKPKAFGGISLHKSGDVTKVWKTMLDASQDGRGLKDHGGTKPHGFMLNGSLTLKGWEFIELAKVRGNLVKTKGRSSRGRPAKDLYCDCCKRDYESLAHILQVCPRTHGSRVERHDSMLDCIERSLKDRDACVERETRIPTQEGIRKPDLIVKHRTEHTLLMGKLWQIMLI